MSWTNITIPDRFNTLDQCYEKIAELEFKVSRLNQKLDSYDKEFYNLFKAAQEHKYVELTSGKEKLTLILRESNDQQ